MRNSADGLSSNQESGPSGSIHHDDRQEPTIVRLFPVRGAAIAEEPAVVGVGVEAKILEASDAARAARATI